MEESGAPGLLYAFRAAQSTSRPSLARSLTAAKLGDLDLQVGQRGLGQLLGHHARRALGERLFERELELVALLERRLKLPQRRLEPGS